MAAISISVGTSFLKSLGLQSGRSPYMRGLDIKIASFDFAIAEVIYYIPPGLETFQY
jgi:hypothetical protein